jgi:hypothetical protein
MLPWSVMPIAGWPSAAAAATSSSRRAAPSSIENSVWTCRWVNESIGSSIRGDPAGSYTAVVPTFRDRRVKCATGRSQRSVPGRRITGRCRGARPDRARPGPWPPGSWRICSSCWRAAICWANSVAWMPWNSPSSQPTSWAWAIRSSASLGRHLVVAKGRASARQLVAAGRATAPLELLDRRLVDLGAAARGWLVERRLADLVEELLDHRADPHHLGRLSTLVASPRRAVAGPHALVRLDPRSTGVGSRSVVGRSDIGGAGSGRVRLGSLTRMRPAGARASRPAVSDPWRPTSSNGPVSAGRRSHRLLGHERDVAQAGAAAGDRGPNHPRRCISSRVTTQATSPWCLGRRRAGRRCAPGRACSHRKRPSPDCRATWPAPPPAA